MHVHGPVPVHVHVLADLRLLLRPLGADEVRELYGKAESLIGHVDRVSKLIESLEKVEQLAESRAGEVAASGSDLPDGVAPHQGTVTFDGGNKIQFRDADIMTPNYTQVLAKGLRFELERGKDLGLLVTGPNGVGKTST